MWVAPDSPVRFVAVAPGELLTLGGYDVRVLAAAHGVPGSCVLYDVTGPGGRLLYATDTGPLPAATRGRRAPGRASTWCCSRRPSATTSRTGPTTSTWTRSRTRCAGSAPSGPSRATPTWSPYTSRTATRPTSPTRLAAWGARVVPDGTTLGTRPEPAPVGRTLVIGGARSGKSSAAEALLAAESSVTYVATAYPPEHDHEWSERVRRHQDGRPGHWSTLETTDLVPLLGSDGDALLVDCLTLWLTRVMDAHDAWDDDVWAARAAKAVAGEVDALVDAWRTTARRVVAVTNEVGQGVVPDTAAGRRFRDVMGRLNAAVAAVTEDVRWCTAGRVTRL